jgi:hypothetical protein
LKIRRQTEDCKKILARIYKKLSKFNLNRTKIPIKNKQNSQAATSSKRKKVENNYVKRCSIPLTTREM